jgi:hypothetical protein
MKAFAATGCLQPRTSPMASSMTIVPLRGKT